MTCRHAVALAIVLAAAPALAQPRTSQHPRIGQLAELTFSSGSASLLPGNETELGQIAAWAHENPDARIVLDGHADRTGTARANIALSLHRAQAVRDSLTELGVDADQIVIAAYGNSGPVRANNRRVVVWGTRAGIDAIVARTLARGNALILNGRATVATR